MGIPVHEPRGELDEYVDDRVSALSELRRVLKDSGVLLLSRQHPTADWIGNGGSYFDTGVIEETWSRGWNVRYWRAPLEQTCDEVYLAGFLIERLIEPRPAPEAANVDAEDCERVQTMPGFLAMRLVPRT